MTNGAIAAGGAGGAAAAAAIANAIKASGAIVQVEARDFEVILERVENPLVVCAETGIFSTKYRYLVGYKGLVFTTKTPEPLDLRPEVEVVSARKIWIPG